MIKKILYVEDDKQYQDFIAEVLQYEGYEVKCVNNASDGLKLFKQTVFDLVITDLKMDVIDGLQFFSLLRKIDETVKVIILTGSNHDSDEIKGIDNRVNDYIKKPVSIEVLLARVARVIRDKKQITETELYSEPEKIHVDLHARKVYQNGERIDLTNKEYELLVFFLKHRKIVLKRETILKEVWRQTEEVVDLRTVDTHVKKIRAKLILSCIYSIRGVGYEWVE